MNRKSIIKGKTFMYTAPKLTIFFSKTFRLGNARKLGYLILNSTAFDEIFFFKSLEYARNFYP